MAQELVLTPGGYRPRELVHKLGPDRNLRILTERLQGLDESGKVVADFGSIPRDGGNPALTPALSLPPDAGASLGNEPGSANGGGWIAYAHWTNESNQPVSSFRTMWTVPSEPESRSGQTIFLFSGMQDSIPMTLLPALQWGPSAAGGGDYWSVASWYVGGTTGAVFHGGLAPVNVGDELAGVITMTGGRREHCDYQCEFEGIGETALPVNNLRQLTRCGEVLAAYGTRHCSDYPDTIATGFRGIEIRTGLTHPIVSWTAVDANSGCGQRAVVLSNANPGGAVNIQFHQAETAPDPDAAQETDIPRETSVDAGAAVTAASDALRIETAPVDRQPEEPKAIAVTLGDGRLVEITINNHGSAATASGSLEARLATVEAAMAGLAQFIAPGWRAETEAIGEDDLTTRLERLAELRATGMLTDDEYSAAKTRLIAS